MCTKYKCSAKALAALGLAPGGEVRVGQTIIRDNNLNIKYKKIITLIIKYNIIFSNFNISRYKI